MRLPRRHRERGARLIAAGAKSARQIRDTTGAGGDCASCVRKICAILKRSEEYADRIARGARHAGRQGVIEFLNEQLTAELTAINQYFLHAKMQENWGYTKLAELHPRTSPSTRCGTPSGSPTGSSSSTACRTTRGCSRCASARPSRSSSRPTWTSRSRPSTGCGRGIVLMREKGDVTSARTLRGDPRGRGAPHRLPGDPARADREARRAALPRPVRRAAVGVDES